MRWRWPIASTNKRERPTVRRTAARPDSRGWRISRDGSDSLRPRSTERCTVTASHDSNQRTDCREPLAGSSDPAPQRAGKPDAPRPGRCDHVNATEANGKKRHGGRPGETGTHARPHTLCLGRFRRLTPRSPKRSPRALRPGEPGYRKSLFDQACARRQIWSREGAAEIGISQGHLMRILQENHKDPRRPPPELAQRIADFCEVPVAQLFPDVSSS